MWDRFFPTASLHRDHSISYALVCEKEISHMGTNNGSPKLVCNEMFNRPALCAAYKCTEVCCCILQFAIIPMFVT